MKKLGTIENNVVVYQLEDNTILIQFETENHVISLDNFKWIEEISFETLNYHATLVIDGKPIATCFNEGSGASSWYNLINADDKDLLESVIKEVENIPYYYLPHLKTNFCSTLDALSNIYSAFHEVKTEQLAKLVLERFKVQEEQCKKMVAKMNNNNA